LRDRRRRSLAIEQTLLNAASRCACLSKSCAIGGRRANRKDAYLAQKRGN
jgi:hypothetical protein